MSCIVISNIYYIIFIIIYYLNKLLKIIKINYYNIKNRYLLSSFSRKFRNIFAESDVNIIKISDVNYSTFYLMIEQFYYIFKKNLKYDFNTL